MTRLHISAARAIKKKYFSVRFFKLVGKRDQVQSSDCPAQVCEKEQNIDADNCLLPVLENVPSSDLRERRKQRRRPLLSSYLSHVKVMPTILEEDESEATLSFPANYAFLGESRSHSALRCCYLYQPTPVL
ncbi:unnamed protein product [Cylicocyclus nassatus]|uniref:Uncharacterized protein n=1 Tax=Cylicocyclus nassatus TaxID=53992 RepID=A0AA36GUJ1_CYLNA|nr:unnamed protein product [Cylicocyclus nassatus]